MISLMWNLEKKNTTKLSSDTEDRWLQGGLGGIGVGEMGEASQKVQTPSCRINVMGVLVTVVNNVQCAVRKCTAGCENKLGIVNLHNDSL